MKKIIFFIYLWFFGLGGAGHAAHKMACTHELFLGNNRALDIFCLRAAYPQIGKSQRDEQDNEWLLLQNGQRVPYFLKSANPDSLAVDLASSLKQPYFLEPKRQDTPAGYSPGRKRCYEFLQAIYGESATAVSRNSRIVKFMGKNLRVASGAAEALDKACRDLPKKTEFASWLKPEGAFYWRKIAGEDVLSSHSFGIAIDLGVKKAPYWRWSKTMPHPLQKTYPGEIVKVMEDNGFIWGGKWHEYDLMHFEYRPELICKAKFNQLRSR